jgi:hypothetical protein
MFGDVVHETRLDVDGRPEDEQGAMWWKAEKDCAHKCIWGIVAGIEHSQQSRWVLNIVYASLYENVAKLGVAGRPLMVGYRTPSGTSSVSPLGASNRSQHNVVKSGIDTAYAQIAKDNPRVKFTTMQGSWSDARRAQKLTQYVDGLFDAAKAYEHGALAFRDAMIFDLGCLHIYRQPGSTEIKVERVLPLELIVDEDDGAHKDPRQMHRKREMPREILLSAYPSKREEICAAPKMVGSVYSTEYADNVIVIESWHLPSGPKEQDGRHILSLQGVTLLDEPWDKHYFPFVFWRWTDRVASFWGMSLCEEMSGLQLRINKIDKQISASQDLMCVPRCFIEEGSVVNKNTVWDFGVVRYRGTPPTFNTSPAMPGEIYQERDREIERTYELTGVSQMDATAQKPAGLDSQPSLREWKDQTSQRFVMQGKRYEQGFIEVARVMVDMSRDMYEEDKSLKVKAIGSKFIRSIKWKDVDLDEDRYIMRAWPVSQLPQTPSGRLQFVQELAQAGWLDPDMAKELMQISDIEQGMSWVQGPFEAAMTAIELILDDGEDVSPEPFFNYPLTLKLAQAMYCYAWSFRDPALEDNLLKLNNFITAMIKEQQRLAAEAAAAAPPAQQAPQAAPAPPPTSDLLPNAA